jgi:hypothetical protein
MDSAKVEHRAASDDAQHASPPPRGRRFLVERKSSSGDFGQLYIPSTSRIANTIGSPAPITRRAAAPWSYGTLK